MEPDRKLKTALDESRLLILGVQVLFGFQFESIFQPLFPNIGGTGKIVQCIALLLLLMSTGCLIAPSLHHQILFRGESAPGAIETATVFAGLSFLPLTLGLGASTYVVFDHLFGFNIGFIVGCTFTAVSLALLYGVGLFLRDQKGMRQMTENGSGTPLSTRIDQMLTEARVIIPGGQALLGFQLIATFSESFVTLPASAKYIHAAGLCAVALAVTLLMTPAAVHRIAYGGEDNETFFRIGSRLVVAAGLPLAIGISSAVYIVFLKVSNDIAIAALTGACAFAFLAGLWLVYPMLRRVAGNTGAVKRQAATTS